MLNGQSCSRMTVARPRAAVLRHHVLHFRGVETTEADDSWRWTVPEGFIVLTLTLAGDGVRTRSVCGTEARFHHAVRGLHTRPLAVGRAAGARQLEVLLAPWAAAAFPHTHAAKLVDRVQDAQEVLQRNVDGLARAAARAADWPASFSLLEETLIRWFAPAPLPSEQVVSGWHRLRSRPGLVSVTEAADSTGWGRRHFESRFSQEIGLSPKRAARSIRLARALTLLAEGHSCASAAAECGFSDQAHMSREVRTFTGTTPGRFTALHRAPVPAVPETA